MEELFISELNKYNLIYLKIENENSLEKIYNLFKNIFKNNIFEEPSTDIEYFYYGVYYETIGKNYDLMKKYYLMAIELNNSKAMNNLAGYYQYIEKNYDLMKKYYLMAIQLNNPDAMYYLADYYETIEKNYDLMKKYYLMAIELNNSDAMDNLADYYRYTEKNYELMKKYFLMAIELNHSNAMNSLAFYYETNEENYDLMKKYYLMAIELNHSSAMYNLAHYYQFTEKNYDLMKKYYLMAIELNHSSAMYWLTLYYKNKNNNDQTFVELYKYEDKDKIINLFNDKFENNINLDQKYYYSFLQWKNENRSNIVKIKQDILRKTNIFPKNYDEKYLNHFNKIVNLKNTKIPKDILNLIAGHLFKYYFP